jgi:hypothetical protein
MRKAQIAIVLVVVLAAFAAADYYLNNLGQGISLQPQEGSQPTQANAQVEPASVQSVFKVGDEEGGFKVVSVKPVSQIFEKIDLSGVKNIQAVQMQMEKPVEGSTEPQPLSLYEVRGAKGQGGLTYLAVKLQFVAQISATETVNEDSRFGDNSFFYNDLNLSTTGFLVTQVGDSLYGFQYSKKDSATYASIQKIIQDLTAKK